MLAVSLRDKVGHEPSILNVIASILVRSTVSQSPNRQNVTQLGPAER